jgi:hypothetical protein
MTAVKKDLYIEQGTTFKLGFNWYQESLTVPGAAGEPYNLTGVTVRMQVRKTQQQPVIIDATSVGVTPAITIDPLVGRIDVKLPATATSALINKAGVYDLEVEFPAGGDTYRVLEGAVVVSPNITQTPTDPVLAL